MTEDQKIESLLCPYRVLDLADEKGFLCGKILGDLGADVIKVERPGGDPSRNIGRPFYHDIPHPEKSLLWFAFNTSKRGITLNIETKDGQVIFKRLAKTADFVVESFSPGYMDKLGLGYKNLNEINPQLIMVSVSPFGQGGPCHGYKGTDIVIMATGGQMYQCGDPDRAPLRFSIDQAYLQAGAQAAVAALIAHYHRQLTEQGQHADVSMQECILGTTQFEPVFWHVTKRLQQRLGDRIFRGHLSPRQVYPCEDGYVGWRIFTAREGHRTNTLTQWMAEEGAGGELKSMDWRDVDMDKVTQDQLESWEEEITSFFLTHTKAELHEEAVKRGFLLFPVNTTEDILKDRQLAARKFWVKVEHPELGASLTYPGAPFKSNQTQWRISRRAPLVGEHNEEIYEGELGLSKEELIILKQAGVI